MPEFPEERVSDGPPFINTGVDFAGLLYVQNRTQAFRRLTSQRGIPSVMISDNAKVFQSASSVIKKVVRAEEVNKYMVNNQIRWNFIMEKAPGGGGLGTPHW